MVMSEKLQAHFKKSQSSWDSSYIVVEKLIKEKNLKVGAEIGLGYGGNSENMLKIKSIEHLYGIDPFAHREGVSDVINFDQQDFDEICKFVLKKLSPFGNRFKFIRKLSVQAAADVPDNLDFVYIDGDHSYQGVSDDLCAWTKKVKAGGVIAGHDYNHPNLPGVKRAIDEFFRRFGWEIHTKENFVWWVEKKPLNISFFIPTYNYGKSIREAVESIVKDNFSPGDELIIVNDGSTDNTAQYLAELKAEYPEIQIINQTVNRGPAATRNNAVLHCKHAILFSHDHDNILVPGSIKKLKEFMINSGTDVAVFGEGHFFIDNKNNVKKKWVYKEGFFTLKDCFNGSPFPGSSGNYMFTKESWKRAEGYPDSWLDSWGLGIRQIATGSKMIALPGTFYWHRYKHSHGYESTHMKGVRTGRISSLSALQILIPFLPLLERQSINYIMGERGREHWFERLEERPLRARFNTIDDYNEFLRYHGRNLPLSARTINYAKEIAKKNPVLYQIGKKIKSLLRQYRFP